MLGNRTCVRSTFAQRFGLVAVLVAVGGPRRSLSGPPRSLFAGISPAQSPLPVAVSMSPPVSGILSLLAGALRAHLPAFCPLPALSPIPTSEASVSVRLDIRMRRVVGRSVRKPLLNVGSESRALFAPFGPPLPRSERCELRKRVQTSWRWGSESPTSKIVEQFFRAAAVQFGDPYIQPRLMAWLKSVSCRAACRASLGSLRRACQPG